MSDLKKQKATRSWLRILIPSVLIIVWLALAGIGGPYFGKIDEVASTDLTTFLPESAEATKVNERLADFQEQGIIPAIVVFEKQSGTIASDELQQIQASAQKLADIEGVKSQLSPPLLSEDKEAAYAVIPLDSDSDLDAVFSSIRDTLSSSNLSVEYQLTGPASFSNDLKKAFAGIDGILLLVALAVVFAILLVVYRSPILPIAVLMVAMCALAVSILIVWQLAKADIVQLNGQVQGILFILVIGATTDYSLLYIARYREELQLQKTAWLATVASLKASFEPILASGGTVIVGLLCLLFSDLSSNKALGPVGGIGIALAIMSALTFLPAVLLLVGRSAFWPRRPKKSASATYVLAKQHPLWSRFSGWVQKRPRLLWIGSSLILLVAALGSTMIKADGVPQSDLILGYSEARDGQKTLNDHFPAGSGSPASIIAPEAKLTQLVTLLDRQKGVDGVSAIASGSVSGRVPLGKSAEAIKADIRSQVKSNMGVRTSAAVIDAVVDKAYPFNNAKPKAVKGDILLQATLSDLPDSDAAKDTVISLRKAVKKIDSSIIVGGVTAVQYDVNAASIHDRTVILPLILLAITIILMLLLRSILAPLLLLATTLLSFFATLGIAAVLFNNVWQFPGADPSVVLYGFVFLVALGIDYNIFLMTRIREESLKTGTRKGVIKGLIVTGGVITSAGVVLAATFAALAVIPILFLAQLAFLVAFGVLLDTIIIRSIIVPALILDVGSKVWWPSKLSRKQ